MEFLPVQHLLIDRLCFPLRVALELDEMINRIASSSYRRMLLARPDVASVVQGTAAVSRLLGGVFGFTAAVLMLTT